MDVASILWILLDKGIYYHKCVLKYVTILKVRSYININK